MSVCGQQAQRALIFAWGFPKHCYPHRRCCVMDFETFVLVSSYLFIVATLSVLSVVILLALKWRSEAGTGIVSVVVLGDIGRSPRMQYHTLAMAQFGFEVDLVGFAGAQQPVRHVASSRVLISLMLIVDCIYFHYCHKVLRVYMPSATVSVPCLVQNAYL